MTTAVIFLPHDAIHSADYAVARFLSGRPSVTRQYPVKTAKHIFKLFLHHQVSTPF